MYMFLNFFYPISRIWNVFCYFFKISLISKSSLWVIIQLLIRERGFYGKFKEGNIEYKLGYMHLDQEFYLPL